MLSEELANSEGSAASMREEMEENLGGSLRSLKSALEGLAISFYETGDGPVRSFVDWLTELVRGFINLDDNVKQTIVIIAGIAAAIGPVLIAMGMLLESINTIGVAIQSLGTVFGGVSLRSEEHTSELQSRGHLVCRLLLEKKKKHIIT